MKLVPLEKTLSCCVSCHRLAQPPTQILPSTTSKFIASSFVLNKVSLLSRCSTLFSQSPKNSRHTLSVECRAPRSTRVNGRKYARRMAVAVPVRQGDTQVTDDLSIEVLMVTDRSGTGYVLPKGGVEDFDGSYEKAAKREAMEEAGVLAGFCSNFHETEYSCNRLKKKGYYKGRCYAKIYVLEVETELEDWPEMENREREWCTLEDAKHRVKHVWMRDCLSVLEDQLREYRETDQLTTLGDKTNPKPLSNADWQYIMAQ